MLYASFFFSSFLDSTCISQVKKRQNVSMMITTSIIHLHECEKTCCTDTNCIGISNENKECTLYKEGATEKEIFTKENSQVFSFVVLLFFFFFFFAFGCLFLFFYYFNLSDLIRKIYSISTVLPSQIARSFTWWSRSILPSVILIDY